MIWTELVTRVFAPVVHGLCTTSGSHPVYPTETTAPPPLQNEASRSQSVLFFPEKVDIPVPSEPDMSSVVCRLKELTEKGRP